MNIQVSKGHYQPGHCQNQVTKHQGSVSKVGGTFQKMEASVVVSEVAKRKRHTMSQSGSNEPHLNEILQDVQRIFITSECRTYL
jgi:hypothetical protein